jgi:hypothetical protein
MNCFCLAASTLPGGVDIPLDAVRDAAAEDPDLPDPECIAVVCSVLSAISV